MSRKQDPLLGKIFLEHYKLKKKLGEGAFGKIYLANDTNTKEEYAVKLEERNEDNTSRPFLEIEGYVLSHLEALGIPKMEIYGSSSEYNILVMELLGQSLENLFQAQNKSFSIKTTCMLGIQMIDRIEYIHYKKLIIEM